MKHAVVMSPEAVNGRLRRADELRDLCRTLAGPRLKKDWWKRTSRDVPTVVKEP